MLFEERYLKKNYKCPWCNGTDYRVLYKNTNNEEARKCKCGFAYSSKILNGDGLEYYWSNFLSNVHNADEELLRKRQMMYQIDFGYINKFISLKGKKVLDIGCSSGEFLDYFHNAGAICYGVELGDEAAKEAAKKYKIYQGELPELDIEENFDLIVCRGTLQYFIEPKKYIQKAVSLLKEGGLLYIASCPNSESVCFKLFGCMHTFALSVCEYYAYTEEIITEYINSLGGKLISQAYFYKETPYANVYEDIKKISLAIERREHDEEIDFNSPAFFDNLISLVYRKRRCEDDV